MKTKFYSKGFCRAACVITAVFILLGADDVDAKTGSLHFDPDKVALSETRMWKAYYSGSPVALGSELTRIIRSQFNLRAEQAKTISIPLFRASMMFDAVSGSYDVLVLPDLVVSYKRLKKLTSLSFNPRAAAKAELDWWVARRTPGMDSPEEVGRRIARLYLLLFGKKGKRHFDRAGYLRAKAAHVRDLGGARADWKIIETLLKESYRALLKGM